ncbi:MAG: hypothetical protein RR330_02425 [Alistipes sp.]
MKTTLRVLGCALFLMCFASTGCQSDDGKEIESIQQQWDAVCQLMDQNATFDPAAVPDILREGVLHSSSYFHCKGGELSENVQLWPGSSPIIVLFFADGTCWHCWTDISHQFDGGSFYRIYQWRYDQATQSIVTWLNARPEETMTAKVKALNNQCIILDGDICHSIGSDGNGNPYSDFLRMVMDRQDQTARTWYIEHARNVVDFEK